MPGTHPNEAGATTFVAKTRAVTLHISATKKMPRLGWGTSPASALISSIQLHGLSAREQRETDRKATLHASQSGQTRPGRKG